MPDGGIVTTYTDITDRERAAEPSWRRSTKNWNSGCASAPKN
jgi:hypothetical protein